MSRKAALVREHFRLPGMGQTTARYFRDKLAMRLQAQNAGILVPAFSSLFNDIDITEYLQRTSPPWLIKPRSEASATGIRKVYSFQEAWNTLHSLDDERHNFLIEEFKPGDVYHVDSLTLDGKIIFTRCNQYMNTPYEVAHDGGIFRSLTLEYNSRDGGANIVEMVAFSSGINLWQEWAKIETAFATGSTYELPPDEAYYSGIIISLASHEYADYTPFKDPEIVWKMDEPYHVGLIIRSENRKKRKLKPNHHQPYYLFFIPNDFVQRIKKKVE
jgi:hypothetical protein